MSDLHGVPTAAELIEAVREYIERDVMNATGGRVRFHARVAAKALAIVERELLLGPEQRADHEQRLVSFSMTDEHQLAGAIRDGSLDDRLADVMDSVRADVAARLAVANPDYARPAVAPQDS